MFGPAARVGDFHLCPMQTPAVVPIPHVGGPVLPPGTPNVMIEGMPAACVGDMMICVGPPDIFVMGSAGVFIGGRPAVRVGDMTAHLGSVVMGAMTVMIGDVGGGGGGAAGGAMGAAGSAAARTMSAAKAAGAAFVEADCAKKTVLAALGDHPALRTPPKDKKPAWIEIELVDDAGAPIAHERYRVVAPDGTPYEGWTDAKGIARIEGLDPGQCEITLPDLDKASWK